MKRKLESTVNSFWNVMRSPRTIAFLKLGAAVIGVVHAIEELRDTPKKKQQIGFRLNAEE